MVNRRLGIPEILYRINNFNVSVAKNIDNEEIANFTLRYCIPKDTLHSFFGEKCYNCSYLISPNVLFSPTNLLSFEDYFGQNYHYKIIELIDQWTDRNNFPRTDNPKMMQLPEHKKLVRVLCDWMNFSEEEKMDKFLDLYSINRDYHARIRI